MESVLLNAFFEGGNTVGYYSAAILTIIFTVIWIWVMYKYLDTTDLK